MENYFKLIDVNRKPIINAKGKEVIESLNFTSYEEIKRTVEIMQSRAETMLDVEDLTNAVIMFVYNNQSLAINYEAGKTELVRMVGKVIGFIEKIDDVTLEQLAEREAVNSILPRINKNRSKGVVGELNTEEESVPPTVKYQLRGLGCNGEIIKNNDNLNVVLDINELSERCIISAWCEWLDESADFLDSEEKLHSDGFSKALLQLFDKEDKVCWNYLYTLGKTMSEDVIKEILTTITTLENNVKKSTTKMSVF